MEPSQKEKQLQKTAKLLKFVREKLGLKVSKELNYAADTCYCHKDYVAELCETLRELSMVQIELIVYNAKDKTSRELATWWEEHQKADKEQEKDEAEAKELSEVRAKALKKLTKKERESLGL